MRNTLAVRRALAVGIPAAVAAILAQRWLQPHVEKGLKVR